ncbi:MAG: hypothetical protein ACOY82_12625 [Pseudomonadota bacterium]
MIAFRWMLVALICATGTACTPKISRVTMDTSRLENVPAVRLSCAHRLADVVDARPDRSAVGGLGKHLFHFDDPAGVIRRQLIASGFSDASGEAPSVSIRLVRLYMEGSHVSKIPVVVYETTVDAQPSFLIRSQKTSINWNGTENEAYAAFAGALQDANRQLIVRLNAGCRR